MRKRGRKECGLSQGAGDSANPGTDHKQAGFSLRLLVPLPLPFSDSYSHPWHQGLWRKREKNEWGWGKERKRKKKMSGQKQLDTAKSTSGLPGCLPHFPLPHTLSSFSGLCWEDCSRAAGEGGELEWGWGEKAVQNINWSCEVASWLERDHLTSCFSSSCLLPSLCSGLELS